MLLMKRLMQWLPALALIGLLVLQKMLEHDAEQRGHARGVAQAQAEYEAISAHAQAANEMHYRAQIEKLVGAQNEHTKNIQHARADADRARIELGFLRAHIADAVDDVHASTPTASNGCAAERDLLKSMGAALEELANAGTTLAEQADIHAADSLMFQRAWPK